MRTLQPAKPLCHWQIPFEFELCLASVSPSDPSLTLSEKLGKFSYQLEKSTQKNSCLCNVALFSFFFPLCIMGKKQRCPPLNLLNILGKLWYRAFCGRMLAQTASFLFNKVWITYTTKTPSCPCHWPKSHCARCCTKVVPTCLSCTKAACVHFVRLAFTCCILYL